jgi:hypothetical protein
VAVLNESGSSLEYSTLLGGALEDLGNDIQIDGSGLVYFVGITGSTTDFPTTADAYQPGWGGGNYDGFLVELPSDLSTITYGTFIGGSDYDGAGSVQLRAPRVLTIAGSTRSSDLSAITPATAVQTSNAGGNCDYFLCRLDLDQVAPLQ